MERFLSRNGASLFQAVGEMSLLRTPHAITVESPLTTIDGGGSIQATAFAPGAAMNVFMQPMPAETAFKLTGLTLMRPWRCLADDGAVIPIGARITFGTRKLFCSSVLVRDAGMNVDHQTLIFDEVQYG